MLCAQLYHCARVVAWISCWAVLVGLVATTTPALAGEMYHWVDEQGRIHLTDTPPKSRQDLQDLKIYTPGERPSQPDGRAAPIIETGRAKLAATKPGGVITVEALLNRRLTVPLLLDTGADLTVLTKQVAAGLRILGLERLPTLQFSTPGGMVNFPVTTLQSLRVGSAEVRDVNVAIDIDGHLPVGLLGMSFLRHFKVTMDQQRGQVRFDR
jgi:clan AA aspartic protease (TIGR02281 family)